MPANEPVHCELAAELHQASFAAAHGARGAYDRTVLYQAYQTSPANAGKAGILAQDLWQACPPSPATPTSTITNGNKPQHWATRQGAKHGRPEPHGRRQHPARRTPPD